MTLQQILFAIPPPPKLFKFCLHGNKIGGHYADIAKYSEIASETIGSDFQYSI